MKADLFFKSHKTKKCLFVINLFTASGHACIQHKILEYMQLINVKNGSSAVLLNLNIISISSVLSVQSRFEQTQTDLWKWTFLILYFWNPICERVKYFIIHFMQGFFSPLYLKVLLCVCVFKKTCKIYKYNDWSIAFWLAHLVFSPLDKNCYKIVLLFYK